MPVIGFIAHVDTSPEVSGANVRPIVHQNYDGRDLVLPDDPALVLREADNPELAEQRGNDIITASGLTLLGSDDKSGVAEIMAAAEYLLAHPDIPHGPIRIGFTPDEEVGRGTQYFDVTRFGARYAYTLDGSKLGDLEVENFSADAITVTFKGFNAHPATPKAAWSARSSWPRSSFIVCPDTGCRPRRPTATRATCTRTAFRAASSARPSRCCCATSRPSGLDDKARMLTDLADEVVRPLSAASVEIERSESYRNMKEVLDRYPEVVGAREGRDDSAPASRRDSAQIRGGTDGARLSFMGLPTPNLFAGEHNIHSRLEWTSVQDMDKAVEVIVEICRSWAE